MKRLLLVLPLLLLPTVAAEPQTVQDCGVQERFCILLQGDSPQVTCEPAPDGLACLNHCDGLFRVWNWPGLHGGSAEAWCMSARADGTRGPGCGITISWIWIGDSERDLDCTGDVNDPMRVPSGTCATFTAEYKTGRMYHAALVSIGRPGPLMVRPPPVTVCA